MKRKLALALLGGAFLAALPALAQQAADLPKFPTPPPKVTAEDSIINPPYADAPEYKVDPTVPQGEVREYRDPDFKDDLSKFPVHRMDCTSCHSRPAHKIHPPNDAVDLAL